MPLFENPHDALRYHVSGAIARGEAEAIVEIPTVELALERATAIGTDHGKAAGSWVFNGNSSAESMRAFLAGIEEGDPAVYDLLPSAPLSGEWADAYSVADLAVDTGIDADSDAFGDVCDAYETAWQDAMVQQACADAIGMLPEDDAS